MHVCSAVCLWHTWCGPVGNAFPMSSSTQVHEVGTGQSEIESVIGLNPGSLTMNPETVRMDRSFGFRNLVLIGYLIQVNLQFF